MTPQLQKLGAAFLRYSGLAQAVRVLHTLLQEVEKARLRDRADIHRSVALHGYNIVVRHPERLHIGEGSALHRDTYLEVNGGLTIGRYVHIGKGLTVFTDNHNYRSTRNIPYDETTVVEPVTIEDFVWIGAEVCIVPGVTIGEGAVVGMGAVVTKDVPRGAIVGGNPVQVLGHRDQAQFEALKSQGAFF